MIDEYKDVVKRLEHHLKHYWGNSEAERDVKNALALLKRYREGLENLVNPLSCDEICNEAKHPEDWDRAMSFYAKQILGGSGE